MHTISLVFEPQVTHPRTVPAIRADRHVQTDLLGGHCRADREARIEVRLADAARQAGIVGVLLSGLVRETWRERLIAEAAARDASEIRNACALKPYPEASGKAETTATAASYPPVFDQRPFGSDPEVGWLLISPTT